MSSGTYTQSAKEQASVASLGHAVRTLTTERRMASCVPEDYVRRVRAQVIVRNRLEAEIGRQLDDETAASWEPKSA